MTGRRTAAAAAELVGVVVAGLAVDLLVVAGVVLVVALVWFAQVTG